MSNYKKIFEEAGLQNINELAKKYKKCVIYYHQDLDGVTSAIAMREYLKSYGIEIVGAEWTQYGPRTFANDIKPWSKDTMMVLVDFAHGSPYFTIATDHHDRQIDFEKSAASHARTSPSNVETIDRVIAKNNAFPQEDIDAISMIDSASYLKHGVSPEEVTKATLSALVPGKTPAGLGKNKVMLANVVNRLLLSYKNKIKGKDKGTKGLLLNKMVMECSPSLIAMYQMIKNVAIEQGWDLGEEIERSHSNYVDKQRVSDSVKYDSERGIIVQYGGGGMVKTGSYNRYTPFKLYPDAVFLSIAWPMGLLQVSCNPFKKKMFPDIDLGQIMRELLDSQKENLSKIWTNLEIIKKVSEKELNEGVDAIGYKWDSISSGFLTSFSKDEDVKIDDNKISLYIDLGASKPVVKSIPSITYSDTYDNLLNQTTRSFLTSKNVSDKNISIDNIECHLEKGSVKIPVKYFKDWALDQKINKLVEFSVKNKNIQDLGSYNVVFSLKGPLLEAIVPLDISHKDILDKASLVSNKYHKDMSWDEKNTLSKIKVNAYDMIRKSSGGHKGITNMSGFSNLLGCDADIELAFGNLFKEKNIVPANSKYVDLLKLMQILFVEKLSVMVDDEKKTIGSKTYSEEELTPDLTSTLEKKKILKYSDFLKENKKSNF